jgi:hypothetical protein
VTVAMRKVLTIEAAFDFGSHGIALLPALPWNSGRMGRDTAAELRGADGRVVVVDLSVDLEHGIRPLELAHLPAMQRSCLLRGVALADVAAGSELWCRADLAADLLGPSGLSDADIAYLLDELCQRLGFCLRPGSQRRLREQPPGDVDAFVDAVVRADGLDPTTLASPLLAQARELVAAAFDRATSRPDR